MFSFYRSRFGGLRSWLVIGLLLLIIQLLLLDGSERRPFVQRLVLSAFSVAEFACAKAKQFLVGDAVTWDDSGRTRLDDGELPPTYSPPRPSARPYDLPTDFLAELREAALASRNPDATTAWRQIERDHDLGTRTDKALRLAKTLPKEFWTVNGYQVHDLDLALVLGR